jgi:DNA-binding transcriptional LysR family regulator
MKITDVGRHVLIHATRIIEEMESIRGTVAGRRSSAANRRSKRRPAPD